MADRVFPLQDLPEVVRAYLHDHPVQRFAVVDGELLGFPADEPAWLKKALLDGAPADGWYRFPKAGEVDAQAELDRLRQELLGSRGNPWTKDRFNLTLQIAVQKASPLLARILRAEAGA